MLTRLVQLPPLVVLLVMLPETVRAATLRVPEDYAAIKPALEAAAAGDTVEVGPGLYTGDLNWDLSFGGRDLVLRSRAGAEQTIIDYAGAGNLVEGIRLNASLTSAAVVEGFTFRGKTGWGSVILIYEGARPTLRGCHVVESNTDIDGIPVWVFDGAHPRFEDCVFRDNSVWSDWGTLGLISAEGAELIRCSFLANHNEGPGTLTLANQGTGVVLLEDCVLAGNGALLGGAICAFPQDMRLVRCVVAGNVTAGPGGGILATGGHLVLESCTVTGNHNRGQYGGGGMYLSQVQASIVQTIVSGNCGSPGSEINTGYGHVSIRCSAVPPSGVHDDNGVVTFEDPPVADPPLFCEALECPEWFPVETGDFHLRSDSPCLARFAPCGTLIGALDEGCTAPQPVGACCVGLACYLRTESACESESGIYQGDDVSCFPSACVPIPVETTTWGRIKVRFRR